MPSVFTVITEWRESVHVTQRHCATPEQALVANIGALPHEDSRDDAEGDWLARVSRNEEGITLTPVAGCSAVWLWLDGARRSPQCLSYVVRTDVSVVT